MPKSSKTLPSQESSSLSGNIEKLWNTYRQKKIAQDKKRVEKEKEWEERNAAAALASLKAEEELAKELTERERQSSLDEHIKKEEIEKARRIAREKREELTSPRATVNLMEQSQLMAQFEAEQKSFEEEEKETCTACDEEVTEDDLICEKCCARVCDEHTASCEWHDITICHACGWECTLCKTMLCETCFYEIEHQLKKPEKYEGELLKGCIKSSCGNMDPTLFVKTQED